MPFLISGTEAEVRFGGLRPAAPFRRSFSALQRQTNAGCAASAPVPVSDGSPGLTV